MKKNYYIPTVDFMTILSNDVITRSPLDDTANDIFGGSSGRVPSIED